MKMFALVGMIVALIGGIITPAMASPLSDVCEVRAERISGYSGDRRGLTWTLGQIDFRLSGTFSFGLSHTSGSPTGTTFGPTRAFTGMDALEQRDARKKRKYTEVYNSCMQAG
jgi:hypothetical protein